MGLNEDGSGHRHYSDKNFSWRPGRLAIDCHQMAGWVYNATTSTNIKSANKGGGANEVLNGAINSTGLTGFTMTPSSSKPTFDHMFEIPHDMDLQKPIYWSVLWACSGTSGAMVWTIKYNAYILADTTNGVIADPASGTALDTAIPSQSVLGTGYTLQRTSEGAITAGKIGENAEYIHFQLAADTLTTITSVIPFQVVVRYAVRRLRAGDGMAHDPKAPAFIGAKQYS